MIFFKLILDDEDIEYLEEFPFGYSKEIPLGAKCAIYGFGAYGKKTLLNLMSKALIENIYDQNYDVLNNDVRDPLKLSGDNIDYIFITVINKPGLNSAINFLLQQGIEKEKFVFIR